MPRTQKAQEANLLSQLSLGVNDQLASLIADALLELHYRLVRLPPVSGAVHLVSLAVCTVTGVFLHQPDLQATSMQAESTDCTVKLLIAVHQSSKKLHPKGPMDQSQLHSSANCLENLLQKLLSTATCGLWVAPPVVTRHISCAVDTIATMKKFLCWVVPVSRPGQ